MCVTKLIFKYGTMNSGKSLQLLSEVYDLSKVNSNILILKPDIDTRTKNTVRSRIGIERKCQLIHKHSNLYNLCRGYSFVFIDECQFLTKEQIDILRTISYNGVNVVCYGLLTTFKRELFEGSKRLLEVADEIEELKGRCECCGEKATINIRLVDGKIALEGEEICIGDEEYKAICYSCYMKCLKEERNLL